ncbi:Ras-related protein Rab-30-like [Homarus americanus]|uniref:Ras-related protein Rab-30-like n=1 Tax=Homarus americanus TaxID=6706 RepID=A0A8J5JBS8_HOMAM|nr:Ras-related protein Rab-30-like [Homarus americanus]
MEDYKFLFKVVLIGNAGVGKTCLVRRFTQLQIWDTAGQERFRSITQSYYRSAHALILVYDISSQPTFDCLPDWLREIEQYASCKVLRVLVGNKTDREDRELPTHVGEEFAHRHNMYFIETSAKEADNVEKLFIEIAKELTQLVRSGHFDKDSKVGDLSPQDVSNVTLPPTRETRSEFACCSRWISSSTT